MTIKARKVVSQGKPVGGLIRADFDGGESFSLHGYWMHPSRRANVEVPIFQHEFYPKLDHTELDIKQNVTYREVVVPSIAELHQAGIEVDKAIFVAEVSIHPRYIKNSNFFRGEFPASVKALAKQNGIVFVFPACDMPLAKLKRKQVLNYYRASFSPLYIKGRHYTSGRMNFFFVAPLHATLSLRKTLNLEDKEKKDNLTEGWGRDPLSSLRTRQVNQQVAKQVQKEIHDLVLPLVSSKMDIPLNSAEGRRLTQMMDDPRLAHELVQATERKPNRFDAVKRWVSESFWPRLKYTITSETSQAFDDAARYAVRLALSVAFDRALDKMKAVPEPGSSAQKVPGWRMSLGNTAKRFNYDMSGNSGSLGLGYVGYKSPIKEKQLNSPAMQDKLETLAYHAVHELEHILPIAEAVRSVGNTMLANLLKIVITADDRVIVSLDDHKIEQLKQHNQLAALGEFQDPHKLNTLKFYVNQLNNRLTLIYHEMTMMG
jgi:hypothetical protein